MSTGSKGHELARFLAITIVCLLVFASSALCFLAGLGDPAPENIAAHEAFLDALRLPAVLGFFGAPVAWFKLVVPRHLAP